MFVTYPATGDAQEAKADREEIRRIDSELGSLMTEIQRYEGEKEKSLKNIEGSLSHLGESMDGVYRVRKFKGSTDEKKEQINESIIIYGSVIKEAQKIVREVRQEKNESRQKQLMERLTYVINAGRLQAKSIHFNLSALKDLEKRAEIAGAATVAGGERSSFLVNRAFGDEMGGGVFVNEAAKIPVNRSIISKVEYDLNTGRFILFSENKKLVTPPLDPEMVAVVINCLYYGQGERKEIAMSFNIDPVNMGRVVTGMFGYEKVLFGCDYLQDTEIGRILIDSDDLIGSIWMGKNRAADLLTRKYNYHSLIQLTLDHPVTVQLIKNTPPAERMIDMRVWIRPKEVRLYRSLEDRLEFDDVSFEMFSETVRLDSPNFFKGMRFSNPGADVFTAFFNSNFKKFVDIPLRIDEKTSRPVIPLHELKKVAHIVGVVKWIQGDGQENPILMDTGWVKGFRVRKVQTYRHLPLISLRDVKKETKGPITIYNEHGPSRIIDEQGRMSKVKYDQHGKFKEIVQVKEDKEGRIIEIPGSTIKRASR
jgi:hypothetical protein